MLVIVYGRKEIFKAPVENYMVPCVDEEIYVGLRKYKVAYMDRQFKTVPELTIYVEIVE